MKKWLIQLEPPPSSPSSQAKDDENSDPQQQKDGRNMAKPMDEIYPEPSVLHKPTVPAPTVLASKMGTTSKVGGGELPQPLKLTSATISAASTASTSSAGGIRLLSVTKSPNLTASTISAASTTSTLSAGELCLLSVTKSPNLTASTISAASTASTSSAGGLRFLSVTQTPSVAITTSTSTATKLPVYRAKHTSIVPESTTSSSLIAGGLNPDRAPQLPTDEVIMEIDDGESQPSSKDSSRRAIQQFRESWVQKFKWVANNNGKPFCKVCQKQLQNNIAHLQRHESTALHIRKENVLKNQPKVNNGIAATKKKRNASIKTAELRIVLFLMQNNLPFSLVEALIRLIKSVAPDSEIAKAIGYGRMKAAQTTSNVLMEEGQRQMANNLRENKFSVIIDETTDVSTSKCLAVVCRYYNSRIGRVLDRFVTMIELKSFDARSIHENLKRYFVELDVPIANIIGIATDNASVMAGRRGGVQTLLREDNPHLYMMGCICHTLHLCSSSASKKLPSNLERLTRDIYGYFAHSSKRQLELQSLQEACHTKPHKILKTSSTRWLSLGQVVHRIVEQWPALCGYFSVCQIERNADMGKKIYSELNPQNHLYFAFMSYVLGIINKLNMEFQSEKPRIHVLIPTIRQHYKTMLSNFVQRKYISDDECYRRDFMTNCIQPSMFLKVDEIYLGPSFVQVLRSEVGNISEFDVREVKQLCRSFYVELCTEISKRIDFDDPTLVAVQCLNPRDMGESLMPLINLFPNLVPDCGIDELESEWRQLRNQSLVDLDFGLEEFWTHIFSIKNGFDDLMFPNLNFFIGPLLALPHSSATAERIFSQLNLIKSKQRNKLLTKTVNAIMVAKEMLNGQNADEFEPSNELLNKYHKYF